MGGDVQLERDIADLYGIREAHTSDTLELCYSRDKDTTRVKWLTLGSMHFDSQFVRITNDDISLLGARFLSAHSAIVDYAHDTLYLRDSVQHVFPLPASL